MPAEPLPVEPPQHPLHALTTAELTAYRRQLEGALATLRAQDPASPARADLQARLDAVLAEQDSQDPAA
jgi:hypothetical protein